MDEVIYRTNQNNKDYNKNYYINHGKNLSTGILTNNINNALAYSKYVDAGNVWVNNFQGFNKDYNYDHNNQNQNQYGNYNDVGHGFEL